MRKKPIETPLSRPARRKMRYNIMRMVNKNYDGPKDFEKDILKQIDALNEKLDNFMISWDVSKDEPYILVKL